MFTFVPAGTCSNDYSLSENLIKNMKLSFLKYGIILFLQLTILLLVMLVTYVNKLSESLIKYTKLSFLKYDVILSLPLTIVLLVMLVTDFQY